MTNTTYIMNNNTVSEKDYLANLRSRIKYFWLEVQMYVCLSLCMSYLLQLYCSFKMGNYIEYMDFMDYIYYMVYITYAVYKTFLMMSLK